MSSFPTPITEKIFEYIKSSFAREDDFLRNLKAESLLKGMPEITISADQGAFLRFLIKALKIQSIIEIGSLGGYSAITMAQALPENGKLIAIEINSDYVKFIKEQVHKAGLQNKITVINADAKSYLSTLEAQPIFDLIFVDADKLNYKFYFEKSRDLLKVGGIFAADNGLAFGEIVNEQPSRNPREVQAIRDFNDYILKQEDFYSCLLTIGDGLILSLKIK